MLPEIIVLRINSAIVTLNCSLPGANQIPMKPRQGDALKARKDINSDSRVFVKDNVWCAGRGWLEIAWSMLPPACTAPNNLAYVLKPALPKIAHPAGWAFIPNPPHFYLF